MRSNQLSYLANTYFNELPTFPIRQLADSGRSNQLSYLANTYFNELPTFPIRQLADSGRSNADA